MVLGICIGRRAAFKPSLSSTYPLLLRHQKKKTRQRDEERRENCQHANTAKIHICFSAVRTSLTVYAFPWFKGALPAYQKRPRPILNRTAAVLQPLQRFCNSFCHALDFEVIFSLFSLCCGEKIFCISTRSVQVYLPLLHGVLFTLHVESCGLRYSPSSRRIPRITLSTAAHPTGRTQTHASKRTTSRSSSSSSSSFFSNVVAEFAREKDFQGKLSACSLLSILLRATTRALAQKNGAVAGESQASFSSLLLS